MALQFQDRRDAGRQLAEMLAVYKNRRDILVLGLPRGGVVVAAEVAKALHAPLDIYLVRKLGVPWQPELAMGALAEDGIAVLNNEIVASLNIPEDAVQEVVFKEKKELQRRQKFYRGHEAPPAMEGKEVILVDDGLATGATMKAAVKALRRKGVKKIIAAVPVGDAEACRRLRKEVDELICLSAPSPFESVGQWYEKFEQTQDEEVVRLIGKPHDAV